VNVDNFDSSNIVSQLKVKYKEVFSKDRSSHILNFKAKLKLKDGATPTFHKAYSIPYSKKQEVEDELLNLVKSGKIKKVAHSDWASPIVIVEKSNKNIRVCVDYKVTLHKQLDTDHYLLPLPEDIFSELALANCFCVLDLSGAYQQLLLDDKSQEYMTINTHLGLFRPTRLQFGTNNIFIAGNIQPPTSTSSAYMDSSPSTGQEQNINRLIALYYSALRGSL
ncbi:unnamed protein product, partial [Arctia plantaginis]